MSGEITGVVRILSYGATMTIDPTWVTPPRCVVYLCMNLAIVDHRFDCSA